MRGVGRYFGVGDGAFEVLVNLDGLVDGNVDVVVLLDCVDSKRFLDALLGGVVEVRGETGTGQARTVAGDFSQKNKGELAHSLPFGFLPASEFWECRLTVNTPIDDRAVIVLAEGVDS